MPAWPSEFPAALVDGFRETVPDNTLRSDMDQGPAKVRQRFTAAVRRLTVSYLLSKAQVASLETFYNQILSGGSLRFDYIHPRSGASVSCRFRQPPVYNGMNGKYFRVNVELEVLP
jgi:hypothetical protein